MANDSSASDAVVTSTSADSSTHTETEQVTSTTIIAESPSSTQSENVFDTELTAHTKSQEKEKDTQVPKEEPPKQVQEQQQMNQHQQAKISGYLEKKGKLRMVSSWKKYWFVLEGRLLLYYRSRAEYDTLSPCKGSITLGAPCNIKPGPASHCVFQIETRNNTITLRAENRGEQDKWMLAILGALNQTASSTNQTKLSHFRYSADDLAVRTPTDKPSKPALTRQNTLPERIKEVSNVPMRKQNSKGSKKERDSAPSQGKSIVERLQSIGAQSYTAVPQDMSKISKASPKLPKNQNLQKLLESQISVESGNGADAKEVKDEWIKEEENELYVQLDQRIEEEANEIENHEVIVDNQHYMSASELQEGRSHLEKGNNEPEKHIYQEIIGSTPDADAEGHDANAVMIENTEYYQLNVSPVDYNKNKMDYVEPLYATGDIYCTIPSEPALPPRPNNKHHDDAEAGEKKDEKLDTNKKVKDGEKANRLKKLAKMVKDERKEAGGKRQSFVVRMFKKIKKDDTKVKDKELKEKEKDKAKLARDENTHDNEPMNSKPNAEQPNEPAPDEYVINVHAYENKPDVIDQLVVELKEVLDEKHGKQNESEGNKENLASDESKLGNASVTENNSGENNENLGSDWIEEDTSLTNADKVDKTDLDEPVNIDDGDLENPNQTEKTEPTSSTQLQQLDQPQPQLPLKQKHHDQTKANKHPSNDSSDHSKTLSDFDYDIYDPSQRLNIPRPKLIPKAKRQKHLTNISPIKSMPHRLYQHHHDELHLVAPKEDKQLLTIDEILDDLENHNYEPFSRQKVKELIEKFNDNDTEHESDDEEVVKDEEEIHVQLRRTHVDCERHSEELNSLLDELSKVTNSPVVSPPPPDVASSLSINGPFSEEDWQNIVPIRKRRHSDPDYDIPRPHSALQIIPSDEKEESKMQPTRFFGPVIIGQMNGDSTSCGTSITPDSLEVDIMASYQVKTYTPSIEEDRSMRSYTSHVYSSNESHLNNNNIYTHNSHIHTNKHTNPNETIIEATENGVDKGTIKDDIYAKPKSLSSLIVPKTECEHAFFLNNNNNNNNSSKNHNIDNMDDDNIEDKNQIQNEKAETEHDMSNSICLDSLEPFFENVS